MPENDPPFQTGVYGDYQWLVSACSLDDLLQLCREIVIGRYLAVTSFDSGPLRLSEEERAKGSESRLGVAYSPKIASLKGLPYDAGYEEWYVLSEPRYIGHLLENHTNPFERPADSTEIFTFVNSHMGPNHKDDIVVEMFRRDISRIRPLSYLSDNAWRVTFVTADPQAFAAAHRACSSLL